MQPPPPPPPLPWVKQRFLKCLSWLFNPPFMEEKVDTSVTTPFDNFLDPLLPDPLTKRY